MNTYPIVIIPSEIETALKSVPSIENFKQPLPPKPKFSQPDRFDLITLSALAIATFGLAVLISKFALLVIGIGCLAIAITAYWNYSTYRSRLGQFEKLSQSYELKLDKYIKAKQAHEQQQALYQQPDGLERYRKYKVLEILELTLTTDGFEENINEGMSEESLRERLKYFFGDRIYVDQKVNIPNTDRHYIPDFIYIDTNLNLHKDIEVDELWFVKAGK
jgi:hypothetical protein